MLGYVLVCNEVVGSPIVTGHSVVLSAGNVPGEFCQIFNSNQVSESNRDNGKVVSRIPCDDIGSKCIWIK